MLRSAPILNRVNRFLSTPYYIITVALLSLAAHIFSLELVVYTIFAMVAIYACLLGNDLLPILPLLPFCYVLPSAANNPGKNAASAFSGTSGLWILILGCLIGLSALFFIIRNHKRFARLPGKLWWGMLILCVAFLLSGLGSRAYPKYTKPNLLFAALQCGCLIIPYWLFSCGIQWKSMRKDYLPWTGFCCGIFLLLQIIWSYCTGNVIVDGVICREHIYTGWGMYNNLGSMLAIMIPFAFYLCLKHHRIWLGVIVASLFLFGVLMTCSRGSLLTGGLIYCICLLLMLYYSPNRKRSMMILLCILGAGLVAILVFHKQLLVLFSDLIRRKMDPSSRDVIYAEGLKLFSESPVFGVSFFSPGYKPWDFSTEASFSGFIPPRWHNTVVQMLTSCGVVGLGAYLLHRVQTVLLFIRKRSKENSFILCSIAVLLISSLLDCHLFNLGPMLFYSGMLAVAEHTPADTESITPQ